MLFPYICAFCISYAVILASHDALQWESIRDFMSKFLLLLEELTVAFDLAGFPLDLVSKLNQDSKTAGNPSVLDSPLQPLPSYPYMSDPRKIRSLFPSDTVYRRRPPSDACYNYLRTSSDSSSNRRFLLTPDNQDFRQLTVSPAGREWTSYPASTSSYVF